MYIDMNKVKGYMHKHTSTQIHALTCISKMVNKAYQSTHTCISSDQHRTVPNQKFHPLSDKGSNETGVLSIFSLQSRHKLTIHQNYQGPTVQIRIDTHEGEAENRSANTYRL